MKKAAYGFAGLIVLLVGAALIVPSLVDWNAYKPEIAAEVQKVTGRTLEIGGELEFAVLPTPHLKVSNARLSNAPGATAKSMLSLKELEVSVKLVPLIVGNIEIASVTLIEPVIELEKISDGKTNWVFTPAAQSARPAVVPSPAGTDAKTASDKNAFKLDSLRIQNGTIVYRDTPAGSIERLEKLTADISAQSLTGPFMFDGGMTVRGISLTLAARMSKFAEKGAVPFHVNIGTPGTATTIGLAGTVTDIETRPMVGAKVDGKGANLGALIAALSGGALSAPLAQEFSIRGAIKGSASGVVVNDLAFQLGKSTTIGNVKVDLQDGVKADVALRMQTLDLDAFLATKPAGDNSSKRSDKEAGGANTATKTQAAGPKFELPQGVEANVSFAIEEMIAKKDRVRAIRLVASLKDRKVTLNTLEAGLPGGGQLTASGRMTASGGAISYDGKMSFRSTSLRALLGWLEVDIASVPADRLRRFNFSADINGDAEQVQIANIASQLDASRMNGGVTIALRDRAAFGASVNIDQFNADAYMRKPVAAKAKPSSVPAAPQAAGNPNAPSKGPLAVLNEFDANLTVRVGSLSYQQTAIQGVRLDGTLVNGVLTLRDASVRSLAGTSAQIKGTVTGLSGVPAFKGTIAAASNDLTGLFNVAGIKSSVPPRKLGKMRLSSRTDVSDGKLKINADLQIAEVRAKVTGSATGLPAAPAFNIVLDAKHPELSRLANLFGDGKPGPAVGGVGLKLSLKGNERAIVINADTAVAGGTFRVAGDIATPLDVPKLNIGLELKHPDFVRFAKAIDPGFNPANRRLGALRLAAKLAGSDQNLAIKDLAGNIGPTKISGSGSYAAGPKRPDIKLSLISSVIPLSDFLEAPGRSAAPRKVSGARRPGSMARSTGSGQRWSSEPIDTAAFGLADATIDLRAQALLYDNFRIDQPKIIAVLEDKVLDIRQISGKMFEGGFEMKGKLDGRKVPIMVTTLKIKKANVGKALFQAAEFDIATGVLSFDMNLSAAGKSQEAMIRALNGNGRINVVNGVVKGFDLKRASDDLKNVNQIAGLLGILGSAMRGGSTNFSSLAGTFAIDRGIMRTNDLVLVADAGAADARGFVDLPKWNMDMNANFRLTEHSNAPAFHVRAVGPPDNPRRLFDFQALQAWILQRGVGGLIKNLIPGAKNNTGTPQNQQQQVKPEDILKGLLKGLGR
jgi:uncharacterized protein involved in outer membrane biogenesis